MFPPADGRPEEWEILTRLGGLLAGMRNEDIDIDAIDDGYFSALAEAVGADPAVALAQSPGRGALRLLDLQIRTAPFGDRYGEVPDGLTLEKIEAEPHGIDLGPMVPRRARAARARRRARSSSRRRTSPPTSTACGNGSTGRSRACCWSPAVTCARTTRGCTT